MMLYGQDLLSNDTSGVDYFTTRVARQGSRVINSIQNIENATSANITPRTALVETMLLDEAHSQAVDVGSAETISRTEDATTFDAGQDSGASSGDIPKQLVGLEFTRTAKATGDLPAWACFGILDLAWSRA